MTRLRGMSLTDFNNIVETMRKVYPFKDDEAIIVDTHEMDSDTHAQLDLFVYNKEHDVKIRLNKGMNFDNERL